MFAILETIINIGQIACAADSVTEGWATKCLTHLAPVIFEAVQGPGDDYHVLSDACINNNHNAYCVLITMLMLYCECVNNNDNVILC